VPGEEVAAVSFRVVLERDESGAWIARIPAVPGCHSHGRSLIEARRRVREAVAPWGRGAGPGVPRSDVRGAPGGGGPRLWAGAGLGCGAAANLLGVSFRRGEQVADG